jgi:hypothetical protein
MSISWQLLAAYGSMQTLRPGEVLTLQGKANRELFVVPPTGVRLVASVEVRAAATSPPPCAIPLRTRGHGVV